MKRYEPVMVGTVTKYVFIDSPDITPQELAISAYEISGGAMIKETCFGLQVTGTPDEVRRIVLHIRSLDPPHIFVKDRGFLPGDKRRCRSLLGGARPGFHGLEFETSKLPFISHGLEGVEGMDDAAISDAAKNKRKGRRTAPLLDAKILKNLVEMEES